MMKGILPEEKRSTLAKGYEVIGDAAIITTMNEDKYIVAKAIVSQRKDIRKVLRKTQKIKGKERVAEFEILLGESTKVVHRENHCLFHLDIAKTYFSGKLAYERSRIAQKAQNGEDILVLFCGVGPFLIQIKKAKDVNITGIDSNPAACSYLKKNALLNNVETNVILGDAHRMQNLFKKPFDRIVMPTPYGQDYFLNIARTILKNKGMLHFYTFKKDFELEHFRRLLKENGWEIEFSRNCGSVAPRVSRYVFDLNIR